MATTCPVCGQTVIDERPGGGYHFYDCPLCGKFEMSHSLVSIIADILRGHEDADTKISYAIRQMQKLNELPFLDTNIVKKILEKPLPKPAEQADLFIRWFAEFVTGPGETIQVVPEEDRSIIGAKSNEGFELIIDYLLEQRLIIGEKDHAIGSTGGGNFTLSMEGWNYYENLKVSGAVYRKAFMAMKFGDPTLDEIFSAVFKLSAAQAGFELFNLSEKPKAGLIDDRLRVEIQSSDFLVADLTHDNHGAYWEAGYAEGLGKPVIYTCEKVKFETVKTHFDTNHHLTIVWDKESPDAAGEELKATIRATLPHLAKMKDEPLGE